MKTKYYLYFVVFLISLSTVYSFDTYIQSDYYPNNDKIKYDALSTSHEMVEKNLELDFVLEFVVLEGYNTSYPLKLEFRPFETATSLPIIIKNIQICEGMSTGSNSDFIFIDCERNLTYNTNKSSSYKRGFLNKGQFVAEDYYEYSIFFRINRTNARYAIKLIALYPNYALKQGDLYTVPVNYPEKKDLIDLDGIILFSLQKIQYPIIFLQISTEF